MILAKSVEEISGNIAICYMSMQKTSPLQRFSMNSEVVFWKMFNSLTENQHFLIHLEAFFFRQYCIVALRALKCCLSAYGIAHMVFSMFFFLMHMFLCKRGCNFWQGVRLMDACDNIGWCCAREQFLRHTEPISPHIYGLIPKIVEFPKNVLALVANIICINGYRNFRACSCDL